MPIVHIDNYIIHYISKLDATHTCGNYRTSNCHHIAACIGTSSVQSTGGDDDQPYFISTVAGNGTGTLKVNVSAFDATFNSISGIAQSKNSDLYAVAFYNFVVLKFTFNKSEGTWPNVEVIAGTGSPGRGANDVLGTQSALNNPSGLSLIENANGAVTAILIADMNNNRIRKLDMATRIITTIAGTSVQGNTGDEGPAKDAQLWLPRHVYSDKSNGDIFIADSYNHRIRRVRDGIITTVVGKTCTGSDGLGDGGPATSACLKNPYFFTMNTAGEWFIADLDNGRIRKVFLNGTITTVAGGGTVIGDALATNVKLSSPSNVAFTSSGELLVAEYGKNVRKIDNSGFVRVIAGGGSESPSYNTPIPAKTASIKPFAVAYARDGSDVIFIGDHRGFIFKLTRLQMCYGVKSDNSAVCSGHGSCIKTDECQCDNGWMGIDCSITHCFGITSNLPDRVCSGKGKCVRLNKCHCDDGFRGHKCQIPLG